MPHHLYTVAEHIAQALATKDFSQLSQHELDILEEWRDCEYRHLWLKYGQEIDYFVTTDIFFPHAKCDILCKRQPCRQLILVTTQRMPTFRDFRREVIRLSDNQTHEVPVETTKTEGGEYHTIKMNSTSLLYMVECRKQFPYAAIRVGKVIYDICLVECGDWPFRWTKEAIYSQED